ncbi:protein SERAC1-like [Mya arenaria]|uniref:protein SERAC1-like n=1 Tax=Mya arenaria TaxID=6604 RepID=UPI0022DEDB18|nr:protein SERAC1-like [Mya arenaria]XP_052771941.1 protein SERAC1-like [Mya arenaria]
MVYVLNVWIVSPLLRRSIAVVTSVHTRTFFKQNLTVLRSKLQSTNLRDEETIKKLRQHFGLSSKAKLGIGWSIFIGCVVFVVHTVISLDDRLQTTHSAHEADRQTRFIYPDKPPILTLEDVFPDTFRGKLKYKYEKLSRKVLPWVNSKSRDPAILLNLAESSDPSTRRRGLTSLTADNDWDDHQFRKVSQACSQRTQVSLARIREADQRLFRPMPWSHAVKGSIEDELRGLLAQLKEETTDPVLRQFTAQRLPDTKQKNIVESGPWCFGGTALENIRSVSDESVGQVELVFLEALARFSQVREQHVQMLEAGILPLLQRVLLELNGVGEVRSLVARILANLAMSPALRSHIITGGWAGVLHKWLFSREPSLFFYSAQALANLDGDIDTDLRIPGVFEDGVYPGYPIFRSRQRSPRVEVDIVFIHGLLGGPFKTWRQEDRRDTEPNFVMTEEFKQSHTFFWPKDWLGHDLKEARILNVGYDTELTTWNRKHPIEDSKRTLSSRSASFLEKLRLADVGSRPVIWVGHSMGGLLIKDMLRKAETDPQYHTLLDNTIGILNYSVPHQGSSLPRYTKQYGLKYAISPSVEVQELDEDNPSLKSLQKSFQDLVNSRHIPVLSFGETVKTRTVLNMVLHIVPPESADPGVGEFELFPSDHINICKPRDRNSPLYIQSYRFILACIHQHRARDKKRRIRREVTS